MKTKLLIILTILGIIAVLALSYLYFFMQNKPLNILNTTENKTENPQTQQNKGTVIKGNPPTSIQIINSRNKASEGAQTLEESLNQIEEKVKREKLDK